MAVAVINSASSEAQARDKADQLYDKRMSTVCTNIFRTTSQRIPMRVLKSFGDMLEPPGLLCRSMTPSTPTS